MIHALGSNASVGGRIESVALIGSEAKLGVDQRPDGLHLSLPAQASGKYAYAFRIVLGRN